MKGSVAPPVHVHGEASAPPAREGDAEAAPLDPLTQAPALSELARAAGALLDVTAVADSILDELCAVAPNVLFGVNTFEGARALTMSLSRCRVGKTRVDLPGHRPAYARSEVLWNRWAVAASDRRPRKVHVEPTPENKLSHYWELFAMREYRRIVVCDGARAVAMVGAIVLREPPPDRDRWTRIEQIMEEGAALLRMAQRLRQDSRAYPPPSELDVGPDIAYLSAEGARLAVRETVAQVAAESHALRYARARLEARRWDAKHRFVSYGREYELATCEELQESGGFVLRQQREQRAVEYGDLLEALDRGLTNGEIATLLSTTPRAVKKRLERLYARYGATNRRELLHFIGYTRLGADEP